MGYHKVLALDQWIKSLRVNNVDMKATLEYPVEVLFACLLHFYPRDGVNWDYTEFVSLDSAIPLAHLVDLMMIAVFWVCYLDWNFLVLFLFELEMVAPLQKLCLQGELSA